MHFASRLRCEDCKSPAHARIRNQGSNEPANGGRKIVSAPFQMPRRNNGSSRFMPSAIHPIANVWVGCHILYPLGSLSSKGAYHHVALKTECSEWESRAPAASAACCLHNDQPTGSEAGRAPPGADGWFEHTAKESKKLLLYVAGITHRRDDAPSGCVMKSWCIKSLDDQDLEEGGEVVATPLYRQGPGI